MPPFIIISCGGRTLIFGLNVDNYQTSWVHFLPAASIQKENLCFLEYSEGKLVLLMKPRSLFGRKFSRKKKLK